MTPGDNASAGILQRVEQFGSADLLVTPGLKFGENQFPLIIPKEHAILVCGDKGIAKKGLFTASSGVGFPFPIARFSIQAAQFAKTANAINKSIFQQWSAEHGVQAV